MRQRIWNASKIAFISIFVLLSLLTNNLSYAQNKTIVFATDPDYPPYENYDYNSDSIIGFDIDLAKSLCKKMLVRCEFQNITFPDLLPGLQKNEYDAVIAALSITPSRLKLVDFTQPYFNSTGSFVVAADSSLNTAKPKLAGHTVGVPKETTYEDYLRVYYDGIITVKRYDDIQKSLLDLSQGKIDMVLGGTPVIKNWVNNKPPNTFVIIGVTRPDKRIFGTGFGIAVKKGNKRLLNSLNKALADVKKDGTLSKLNKEYFGD